MSHNLAYRTFAAERLRRYPGSVGLAIQWFLDRDKQTRLVAISLYAEDWPLGEALKVAYESKTAVLWQVGTGAVAAVDDSLHPKRDTPPPQPAKRRRESGGGGGVEVDLSTGKPVTLKDLCDKWNIGSVRPQAS